MERSEYIVHLGEMSMFESRKQTVKDRILNKAPESPIPWLFN